MTKVQNKHCFEKNTNEATEYSYNFLRAVRQGELNFEDTEEKRQ